MGVGSSFGLSTGVVIGGDNEEITIPAVAANQDFTDITLPTITGTIQSAYLELVCGGLKENSGAENYLNGDQEIHVDDGSTGYTKALQLYGGDFRINANSKSPYCGSRMGKEDISALISSGGTLKVRWVSARALGADLILVCYIRIWVNVV